MAAGLVIPRGSAFGLTDRILQFVPGGTITASDLVNVESGQVVAASAGDFLAGQTNQSGTVATWESGTTVQVNTVPGLMVVMDNDNDSATFARTDVGNRFDIIGGTGAQLIDTSSRNSTYTGQTGQMLAMEYNPQDIRSDLDADVSVGLFMIAESQFSTSL